MNTSQLAAMNSVLTPSMTRSLPLRSSRPSSVVHLPRKATRTASTAKDHTAPMRKNFYRGHAGHRLEVQGNETQQAVGGRISA